LTGNTAQELQQNVFKHAQEDHADKLKSMPPQDQAKMVQRIQEIYGQKSGMATSRR
jgi:predicted small metal-binding protein